MYVRGREDCIISVRWCHRYLQQFTHEQRQTDWNEIAQIANLIGIPQVGCFMISFSSGFLFDSHAQSIWDVPLVISLALIFQLTI